MPRPGGNRQRAGAGHRSRASVSTSVVAGSAPAATKGGFRNGKKNKFNAAGEYVDDVWCVSEAEAERFRQLKDLLAAGKIADLRTQVIYPLTVNNVLITRYRADFTYQVIDERQNPMRTVIEDIKGMVTPEFKIKHKLFDATQPVKLTVILAKGMAVHPTRPRLSDKTGKPVRSRAGWIDLHWKGRIPE